MKVTAADTGLRVGRTTRAMMTAVAPQSATGSEKRRSGPCIEFSSPTGVTAVIRSLSFTPATPSARTVAAKA